MTRKIKVKLILELHEQGMSLNEISRTRHLSKHSACQTVNAAKKKGLSFKDVAELTDDAAYRLMFPERLVHEDVYEPADMEYAHKELGKTGVTLKLLHAEYCDVCRINGTIAMGYSKFCRD